jgi:hypothetical protein
VSLVDHVISATTFAEPPVPVKTCNFQTEKLSGKQTAVISLSRRAFQCTIYNGPANALVCNKTVIQMSHIKTLKITPTRFDHQLIIIRELFDPG